MYIFKVPREKAIRAFALTEEITASYAQKHRTKRVHQSPIGPIREVEAVAADKRYFYLQPKEPQRADGSRHHSVNPLVEARQASLQRVVREMDPRDVELLAEYDAYIEEARRYLSEMKNDRARFVRERAWKRAKTIPIRVFYEQADEVEERRHYA